MGFHGGGASPLLSDWGTSVVGTLSDASVSKKVPSSLKLAQDICTLPSVDGGDVLISEL